MKTWVNGNVTYHFYTFFDEACLYKIEYLGRCPREVKIPCEVKSQGKAYPVTLITGQKHTSSYTITDRRRKDFGTHSSSTWSSILGNFNDDVEKVVLPKTVREIGKYAFYTCHKLRSIELNEGLEIIGEYAFAYTENLKEIVIPSSVKKVGNYCFGDKVSIIIQNNSGSVEFGYGIHNVKYVGETFISKIFKHFGVATIESDSNRSKSKDYNRKSPSVEGALPGVFTINKEGDKICFSQGILQYNPAKHEFRFATNQYDVIGAENRWIAPWCNNWIDLFGWGTSGYMGCQPTELSEENSEYGPSSGDIVGTNYDWGVFNSITNGGNIAGIWRTPTSGEWSYLLTSRPNADKLKALCIVCGIRGFILMPDNFWDTPIPISIDTSTTNIYSLEQWAQLESLGVIFMPNAGERQHGRHIFDGWSSFWLATAYYTGAYSGLREEREKWRGHPVRLIKDVK